MLHETQLAGQGKADTLFTSTECSMLRDRQAVRTHAQVPALAKEVEHRMHSI